ncbi:MAG TPA: TetR/AcrR family transcriptional regulator [Dehalococcoidia bacterium]|nr:TetR/AcrR family transcriptional regulator [Dehalococcoidia bacterium]
MNGFERRKERKKESIIRAALELFAQYGFKKVSVSDIAQKADVSPVTVYNHFISKEGLIKATLIFLGTEMLNKYREIIRSEGDFAEKLETIVFDKVGMASQFSGELRSMIIDETGEYQQYFNEVLANDIMLATLELFDEGKKQGYISRYISNEAIITYLEILRAGIASSRMLNAAKEAYPRLVTELNQLFLYGLVDTGDRPELKNKS